VISGLDVSFVPSGVHYGGFSSTGVYSNTYYGQTNPFEYNGYTQRSDSTPAFDAVYNGSVYYDYASPLASFSILWGSVDPDNSLTFFDSSGASIGTLSGADLLTALGSASLPPSELYGNASFQPTVDITISSPTGIGYVGVYGSPSLTFEYSNIIPQTISAVPEPATWLMVLVGFGAIGVMLRSRHRPTEA
jgi:hypothetical protein